MHIEAYTSAVWENLHALPFLHPPVSGLKKNEQGLKDPSSPSCLLYKMYYFEKSVTYKSRQQLIKHAPYLPLLSRFWHFKKRILTNPAK